MSEKEFVGERICGRTRTSLCENEYVGERVYRRNSLEENEFTGERDAGRVCGSASLQEKSFNEFAGGEFVEEEF